MITRTFLFLIALFTLSCTGEEHRIRLSSGEVAHPQSIFYFDLPAAFSSTNDELELFNPENGTVTPVQKWDKATAACVIDQVLPAGSNTEYILRTAQADEADMQAIQGDAELELKTGDRSILTYNIATDCPPEGLPEYYCRSGYIHPLRSPSGAVLTDGFPVGHTHQHGLFFAWVNTTFRGDFTDFWNQHNETGTGAHKELVSTTSGPVFAGFTSKLEQISLKHGPVLDEEWKINTYDLGKYYIMDVVSTQKNITNDTLHINQYHYGGFGIRGSRLWNEVDSLHFKSAAQFLTSEGKTREEANHSRPRWTAMYGETEQGVAGVAILDHPDNFRHPQPVRVHPSMPYFCLAPMVEGAFFIAPDQHYVSKYRVVTFDGEPDTKALNALWTDYAEPLKASVVQ